MFLVVSGETSWNTSYWFTISSELSTWITLYSNTSVPKLRKNFWEKFSESTDVLVASATVTCSSCDADSASCKMVKIFSMVWTDDSTGSNVRAKGMLVFLFRRYILEDDNRRMPLGLRRYLSMVY